MLAGIEFNIGRERMLELDRRIMGMRIKKIYFADHPYDIPGIDWLDFLHVHKKVDGPLFVREEWTNAIIDLTGSEERIWSNMASKCRSDIRKSEKDQVEIAVNENFEEFIKLNSDFRKARGLAPIFGYLLRPPLPEYCTLFTARYQGELIASTLFLRDDREMQGILSASKRLAVDREETALIARATRRLWWEAAKYGREQGLSIMDMGNFPPKGTDADREGVSEIKRRFGAIPVKTYCYQRLSRKMSLARKMSGFRRKVISFSIPKHSENTLHEKTDASSG